jgi:hypothetical protein
VRQELQYGLWILRMSLEGFMLPPIFAILAISFVGLIVSAIRQPLERFWKPYHWYVLTHLSFFAVAIVLGTLGAADGPGAIQPIHPNRAANLCLGILFWASFASCAFWIWRMKGIRWFAASLVGIMQSFVLGAFFIAGMSVAGDWI